MLSEIMSNLYGDGRASDKTRAVGWIGKLKKYLKAENDLFLLQCFIIRLSIIQIMLLYWFYSLLTFSCSPKPFLVENFLSDRIKKELFLNESNFCELSGVISS